MDQLRIKALIDLMGGSDLSELTFSEGGSTLSLFREGAAARTATTVTTAAPAPLTPAPLSDYPPPATATEVCAPLYGILHLTPSPTEPAFVQQGDTVTAGQTLCIVEAMKMFHPVKATQPGTVEALLAQAGDEVDSGQPLFRLAVAG